MINKLKYDLVIVGGGAAGIAAAIKAKELGVKDVILLEREPELGGILQQCIHNGFGLHRFKEELTGPAYIERWIDRLSDIDIKLSATVLEISKDKIVMVQCPEGILEISAKAVIFSVGCMERPRGAIGLPGPRVSGIMTAGSAQRLLNVNGYLPGKKVVILGSGDIGLIMARRMTLEGATVQGVFELMPYSTGLVRNIVQCLEDFDIPLSFSKTVQQVHGEGRLEGITIVDVDDKLQEIKGTEQYIECDTLLLSVGLVPVTGILEKIGVVLNPASRGPIVNHLMETSISGIFACGNVLHVHDLVDNVSSEGEKAAMGAYLYLTESHDIQHPECLVETGEHLIYNVPKSIRMDTDEKFFEILFRVRKPIEGCITIKGADGSVIVQQKQMHLSPGEMEKVIVPKSKINNNKSIVVSIGE